jgi:hypothetical protein
VPEEEQVILELKVLQVIRVLKGQEVRQELKVLQDKQDTLELKVQQVT